MALELPTHCAAIGAELLDDVLIHLLTYNIGHARYQLRAGTGYFDDSPFSGADYRGGIAAQ